MKKSPEVKTWKVFVRKPWRFRRLGSKGKVQRNVKDRLFRFLFEKDREALLQLYNALNGTEYRDALQLEIVTIESAVYVVMKNDLAFVLAGTLSMYEHQSTYSPNLPVRMLNINHGHNGLLMERCGVLKEYAEFVDITRRYVHERAM